MLTLVRIPLNVTDDSGIVIGHSGSRDWGITVNGIAPGFVRFNPNTERPWKPVGEAGRQRPRSRTSRVALARISRRNYSAPVKPTKVDQPKVG